MEADIFGKIVHVAVFYIPFLFSLCVHEFAHGWVALKKGDTTAKMMGRLTLNPMAHADTIGTFVLPLASLWFGSPIFFGWAKPVPVDYRNLKNAKSDMFWIASAGPLSNIILAFLGAFIFVFAAKYLGVVTEGTQGVFIIFIQLNLFLALFNLLPIHPLDGGKVIARFIPASWDQKLQENQSMLSMLLLLLFMSGAMRIMYYPILQVTQFFLGIAQAVL